MIDESRKLKYRDVLHFVPEAPLGQEKLRRQLEVCDRLLAKLPDPGAFHLEHYFADGVYGRAIYIPKGCFLSGKIHKHPQINVLVQGDLTLITESGIKRVTPPFIVVSPAGTKRLAWANEDTIWLTLLPTKETDPDKIEREFTAESSNEYLEFQRQLEHKGEAP